MKTTLKIQEDPKIENNLKHRNKTQKTDNPKDEDNHKNRDDPKIFDNIKNEIYILAWHSRLGSVQVLYKHVRGGGGSEENAYFAYVVL